MESSRYLVVGAGLAGSSIAWQLAERGHEVTLVERTEPAAADGSSHGSARIFRYAYAERDYVDLAVRAAAGWRELERRHGAPLLELVGALDHGSGRRPQALAQVLEDAGVEHELLDAATARSRWPQISFDGEVLHQPGGGVLDPEGTVRAVVALARQRGLQLLPGWELARLQRTGVGFTAHARDGRRIDAGHVVLSAGGWLPDLLDELPLPAGFLAAFPPLQVMEENVFHFPYRDEYGHRSWPTIIHNPADRDVYALPGGRDAGHRGQKVALYNGGRPIASAARRSGVVDPANRERVTAYVRDFLPGLVPEPYAEATCLFTNTPTEDFVIDGVDGITVVSPCSGHGAKFAPVLGEIGADVATGAAAAPERFRVASGRAGH